MLVLFSKVFVGVAASIAAVLALIFVFFTLMPAVRWILQQAGWPSRTVRIEASTVTEANRAATERFVDALYSAFAHFRQSVAVLEGRLVIRDNGLSYFTDCAHLLPSVENIDIQVEVGPVRFGNIAGLLTQYIGRKEFVFKISATGDSASIYSISASLSLNRRLWRTWHDQVASDQVDTYCQRVMREIVWVTSCRSLPEAQLTGYWKQYELRLLEGLERLSDYLMMPADVGTLEEAVEYFNKARHEPWTFQADLLSAIAVSLTQREPRQAVQRMQKLLDEYGRHPRRRAVLLYNSATARFRLYDIDGDSRHYDEAIGLFDSIRRPRLPLWLPSRSRAKAFGWSLYLLAQAGMANCLAHKLNVVEDREKEGIVNRIRAVNHNIVSLLQHLRTVLGLAVDEVEWRIFNAEAVTALFVPLDADEGIEAAKRGLNIDPHNLPLKANLGSLILLQARQADERGDKDRRIASMEQAEQIFLELRDTGWDPGFIGYRLGRIRRLQNKFGEAIELLESAKNKDVANHRIEAEIAKAQARNNQFDC